MKHILVVDNYDSFTYNLVHYLEDLDCKVTVARNDKIELNKIEAFDKILLSPGPGIPDDAGLLKDIITTYASSKSILGICLGMQAIGEVFGAKLLNLSVVYHGTQSKVKITSNDEMLFKGLNSVIKVGRYHSWVIKDSLPPCLEVTSVDENNQIMSIRHNSLDVKGVQFHPESVMTPEGKKILENWLKS